MKALVTGGAGFIGSHLVERLLADGHTVTVIDNLSTGRRENLPSGITIHPATLGHIRVKFEPLGRFDWMFHLAALADIVPSVERPEEYHRTNVDGTVEVLEWARSRGCLRFLYAASSSCYGLATEFPTPETATIAPQYPYALTKWVGEQYALHWMQVYGLPVVSLRLFNVFGQRQRTSGTYGAVMGVFLAQKANGQPLTVVGDGSQTRDFTYVTDVVDAMVKAAESDVTGVFNVGSGGTYAVNDLAEMIGGNIIHIPKRPGEPDCTFADTRKIRQALGWAPRVSFVEGVESMLEHLEDWRQAPVWTPETIATATSEWHRRLT